MIQRKGDRGIAAALAWAPLLAVAALVLGAARYFLQGSGNVYSNLSQSFYVPDADLGWIQHEGTWVWVGLDAAAIVVGAMAGTWIALRLARWFRDRARARGAGTPLLAKLALGGAGLAAMVCVLAPAFPIWAFLSGFPPQGARTTLPSAAESRSAAAPLRTEAKLEGLTPGRYRVLPHERANTLVAQIVAGGEAFDARFSPLRGALHLDPAALSETRGTIAVDAATIDTGIPLRSSHARDDLKVEAHPELSVTLNGLEVSASASAQTINAAGEVVVGFMGKQLTLPLSATIEALDADKRTRLGVDEGSALLVRATMTIPLASTPLDPSSFDIPEIGVTARFILAPDTSIK